MSLGYRRSWCPLSFDAKCQVGQNQRSKARTTGWGMVSKMTRVGNRDSRSSALLERLKRRRAGPLTMLAEDARIRPGLVSAPRGPGRDRGVLIPGFVFGRCGSWGFRVVFRRLDWGGLLLGLAPVHQSRRCIPDRISLWHQYFFRAEREAVEQAVCLTPEEASQRVVDVFRSASADASALAQHALDCPRVDDCHGGHCAFASRYPTADSNYHPKVWLFRTMAPTRCWFEDRVMLQRAESPAVWKHFDVDVTWIGYSRRRVHDGMAILNDWSRGKSSGIERVVEFTFRLLGSKSFKPRQKNPPKSNGLLSGSGGRR